MSRRRVPSASVFDEPHLRSAPERQQQAEDSVWHEPGRGGHEDSPPVLPYADWLMRKRPTVSQGTSTWLFLLMAFMGGPLAIASVLLTFAPGFGVLLYVVTGPLIEELGKILLPLMVVERRPYLIRSSWHVPLCTMLAGLFFSVVENVLYLRIYIPEPTTMIIVWRWTVCVLLHTGCSLLAGIGVMRIHRETMRTLQPPRLETGSSWIVAAVVLHGVYNLIAILLNPLFQA